MASERSRFDDGDDRVWVDEAGQVVDVAVSVVAGDAVLQPDHSLDSKIFCEIALPVRALETWIPNLRVRAEQALLGGEQKTGAVYIDAAAFQHDSGFNLRDLGRASR